MKFNYTVVRTGETIPVYADGGYVPTSDIKIDVAETRRLCASCSSATYNCRPFAPTWDMLEHKKYMAVFWFYIYTADWHTTGTKYDRWVPQQLGLILSSLAKRCGYKAEEYFGGKFYTTGNCRICRPCRNKLNKPCRCPERMRYSLESVGVMVQSLLDPFGHKLKWKLPKSASDSWMPEYTTAVIGIETDDNTQDIKAYLQNFMREEEEVRGGNKNGA